MTRPHIQSRRIVSESKLSRIIYHCASFRQHVVQYFSGCRCSAVNVFGEKLLRELMFLETDGCLTVQDWWRSFCSFSPIQLYSMQLLHHRHLTAKHPHSTVDNTMRLEIGRARGKKQAVIRGCAQLLACKIAWVRESLSLLNEKDLHRSQWQLLGIVDGRKLVMWVTHFLRADGQAVSVRVQSTFPHFCSFSFRLALNDRRQSTFSLFMVVYTHNQTDRWIAKAMGTGHKGKKQ